MICYLCTFVQEEYQLNSQKHWQEQWNRSDQHNPVWSGAAPLQDPGGEWLGVNQQQLGNWQTPNQLEPGSQQWQPCGEGSSSPGWVHSTPQSHTHQAQAHSQMLIFISKYIIFHLHLHLTSKDNNSRNLIYYSVLPSQRKVKFSTLSTNFFEKKVKFFWVGMGGEGG